MTRLAVKLPPPPQKKLTLDVAFINPFLSAVIKTLETQCSTPTKPGKPCLRGDSMPDIAIASVLSLSSNGFNGSIVLGFPESVFLKIYEAMLGESQDSITSETQDAAAELLNIIYGLAKVELNKTGHSFEKAIPTVLVGERIRVRHSGHLPAVQIPFETPHGSFFVGIEFSESANSKKESA